MVAWRIRLAMMTRRPRPGLFVALRSEGESGSSKAWGHGKRGIES